MEVPIGRHHKYVAPFHSNCVITSASLACWRCNKFDRLIGAAGWNNKDRTRSGDHLSFYLIPVFLRWHHRGKGKKFTKPVSIIGWDKDVTEEPCG